jgi:hypothetical protein
MKPYIRQTVSLALGDESPNIIPPNGYHLEFAEVQGGNWHLIWKPDLS